MLHARTDYNRIQDPAGLIPVDEPVFLLRAQDKIAWHIVKIYGWCAELAGLHDIARVTKDWSNVMRDWPVKKNPDL